MTEFENNTSFWPFAAEVQTERKKKLKKKRSSSCLAFSVEQKESLQDKENVSLQPKQKKKKISKEKRLILSPLRLVSAKENNQKIEAVSSPSFSECSFVDEPNSNEEITKKTVGPAVPLIQRHPDGELAKLTAHIERLEGEKRIAMEASQTILETLQQELADCKRNLLLSGSSLQNQIRIAKELGSQLDAALAQKVVVPLTKSIACGANLVASTASIATSPLHHSNQSPPFPELQPVNLFSSSFSSNCSNTSSLKPRSASLVVARSTAPSNSCGCTAQPHKFLVRSNNNIISSRPLVAARRSSSVCFIPVPVLTPSKAHAPPMYNEPKNSEKKLQYAAILEDQIKEAKKIKEQRRADENSTTSDYFPFGRSGGGAPVRDCTGNVVTNVTFTRCKRIQPCSARSTTPSPFPARKFAPPTV